MKMFINTALIGAAAIALPQSASAANYSLASDWSDVTNPNGVWSFVAGSTTLTHYPQPAVANTLNPAAANGYWGLRSDFEAIGGFVLKTTTSGTGASPYNNGDFLAGDVILHTLNDGGITYINWTAPNAGTMSFASSVWYAHSPVTRSDDVAAFLNATSLGSVTLASGVARTSAVTSLSGNNLAVAAGDVLSFRFTKAAGQTFGSLAGIGLTVDFTPRISAVPEPATWDMMIIGFGLVGSALRRRVHGAPANA
jgi:hypothetical protein